MLSFDGNGYLTITTHDETKDAYIGSQNQVAFPRDVWKIVVATYSGSGTATGFNLYIDGMPVTNADISVGTYTAMSDQTVDVKIGTYRGGAGFNTMFLDGKGSWFAVTQKALSANEVWLLNQGLKALLGI